jgi:HEAT repeat protein
MPWIIKKLRPCSCGRRWLAALGIGMALVCNVELVFTPANGSENVFGQPLVASVRAAPPFSAQKLEQEIASRITKNEEFQALREICAALRVRCWLFGGTAAGYAHYVKWDLLRESGDHRYQPDRFDYDYTNIFRSTQDADLVVDGTEAQAAEVERAMKQRFPYFQGSKEIWEVRLLREKRQDKEALLHNPDFLNQHTDSNSTGMIELTKPNQGESIVRDLRDWTPRPGLVPIFLEDVHQGKLHYYFSKLHELTSRAKGGMNPPIFSVIRYLTKAFQYDLEIQGEDLKRIRQIIYEFNPSTLVKGDYVTDWIEKNGKKLFQHAVNLEYAAEVLERVGLRSKLLRIGNLKTKDSLAWWIHRQPLTSKPVGKGSGKTAAELGIDIVAHQTSDFLAYESITRAHTGDSNVFMSRTDAAEEHAIHGDGFYTKKGREGLRLTGLAIRFRVAPNSREGTDFSLVKDVVYGDDELNYVVFHNKNALQVIPESLNVGPVDYFKILITLGRIDDSDRGIIEKVRRRIKNKLIRIPETEMHEIISLIESGLKSDSPNFLVIREFLSLVSAVNTPDFPEVRKKMITQLINTVGAADWKSRPSKSRSALGLIQQLGLRDAWVHNALLDLIERRDSEAYQITLVLTELHPNDPEIIQRLLNLLKAEASETRKYVCMILGTQGSRDPAIIRALVSALEDSDASVRGVAISALRRLEAKDDIVIDGLIGLINKEARRTPATDPEDFRREKWRFEENISWAYNSLEKLAVFDDRTIEVFLSGLQSANANIAVVSAQALGEAGNIDKRIIPALIKAFDHDQGGVPPRAPELWRTLVKIAPKDPRLFEHLQTELKNPLENRRISALHQVEAICPDPKRIPEILAELLDDPYGPVRVQAAERLLNYSPTHHKALLIFIEEIPRYKHVLLTHIAKHFKAALSAFSPGSEKAVLLKDILAIGAYDSMDTSTQVPETLLARARAVLGASVHNVNSDCLGAVLDGLLD